MTKQSFYSNLITIRVPPLKAGALLSIFATCFIGTAIAQTFHGTLRGTVYDVSGAVVPGARVIVTRDATGTVHTAATSAYGTYELQGLTAGRYNIRISAPGFATHTRAEVDVHAAQVTQVSATLDVFAKAESIGVRVGADLVQNETSQLSYTFRGPLLSEAPTIFAASNFGSVQNIAVYLPHTTSQLGGTSGNGGSIGGLRARQNSFYVDGALNTDLQTSTSAFEVIQDAVAEFSLATNQFSAEYGGASGGQFNVVTRTGGNQVHGGLWLYGSNRHINAASAQEKQMISQGVQDEKSRFDYSRSGLRMGGPVLKRKLFFFGAYEFQNTRLRAGAPSILTPTAEGLKTLDRIAANDTVRQLLERFPIAPKSESAVAVTAEGNTYSVPVGTAIARAANFVEQHSYIGNFDFDAARHQLHLRHLASWVQQPNQGPFPQRVFDSTGSVGNTKVILNHTWWNVWLGHDARIAFGRLDAKSPLDEIAASYPTIYIGELGAAIGPSGNLPQQRSTNVYQASENLTLLNGRSTWKFGGEYRWMTSHSNFLPGSRGQHAYQTVTRFVNDQIPDVHGGAFLGIGSGDFVPNSSNYAVYLQNDFIWMPRLTFNLGLRYEFFGLPRDARENAFNSISDCPSCITPFGLALIFRTPKNDRNNFAPRIGFAWDPTGSGKWSVRGGAGLAYDLVPYSLFSTSIPPQKRATLVPSSACSGQYGEIPDWCVAYRAGQPGSNYLATGAMAMPFMSPKTQSEARALTAFMMPDNISPQVYSWSLSGQRELTQNIGLEVSLLGTRALRLPVQTQLNSISIFERGFPGLPTYFSPSEIPAVVASDVPTRAQALALQGLRFANDGFQNTVTAYPAIGMSRYSGLALDLRHRTHRGLTFSFSSTFSSAKDNATNDSFTSTVNPRRAEDAFDLHREWSRSVMDVRRKFALVWVYEVPTLTSRAPIFTAMLRNWKWSGSYLWQGGQPVTLLSGVDSNGNLDSAGDRVILNPNGTDRTGTATSRVCRDSVTGRTSVNKACPDNRTVGYVADNPSARYIQAQLGSRTDTGRNTVSSIPQNFWNFGFFRDFSIAEGKSIQLQTLLFNAFNQRNFSLAPASIFGVNENAFSTSYTNVASPKFLNEKQFSGSARGIHFGARVFF